MTNPLVIAQIAVSALLIAAILLQQRGTALGSAFGQEGGYYGTRRGIQKKLFWVTVALGMVFILLAFLNLLF
ncbi:MAG: preprotein translocase subunit SecG [Candidatus Nealsonbacteria bacterium CG_4_9_14_0_2_um_filter_37_38]|uniref:Protein-export membrane protein SecG n=1 Tax=Candidatus Nealsonbacteria bacterium CG_4_10_14_0_8_um_filter_37_14 TaxID=1974684 RepID=A0A2M7R6F7_9BACT|nr:MAG: preprotein translocase subunit SecG [Candidatus Nealsonbacteria bacterium CG11_big_fil_rev_8_21_14_0_20_37_68]PIY89192.1 MAG: preprotein translocase subunit SecG [Candidatus Nealsonbacteria bacterium CG_4_10_14_0_8_um_filter_37_14]PJC51616.1 MAG: preprotein translocase subunit SecG [Candidatus Nealsonbacteria bacterium CG_4_9_14_0_2_um_filter_37_38]